MVDGTTPSAAEQAPAEAQLERSTYEVIRNRLDAHSRELAQRLQRLNQARRQVFGGIDTRLLETQRITTDNNCIPCDIHCVDDRFLLGYNVHIGLKSQTHIEDVFAIYAVADGVLQQQSLDPLRDARFLADFQQLYQYYRQTRFARFFSQPPYLYMMFQMGRQATDIKAFKWLFADGSLSYVDNRSEHEIRFPPQHEFEWVRTHRDLHRYGAHPHVAIEDRVFVETVGGDLTIKVEDNTDDGQGIYREPVDDPDQTLDDADIFYATVGSLILLKVRPYKEDRFRYLVFNEKLQQVQRLDGIEHACVLLPQGHGLIFGNGYYLQSGQVKVFENTAGRLLYERCIAAPNGEDYLYVFHDRDEGLYVLLSYNVIEQRVQTPLLCHGFSLFADGRLLVFKADMAPQKHHAIQVWQTPFTSGDRASAANSNSYLYKVGNRDLVRGMAECQEIVRLAGTEAAYAEQYLDLLKKTNDVLDAYYWLGHEEACQLDEVLRQIRDAAGTAIEEYEKVDRARRQTRAQFQQVADRMHSVLRDIEIGRFEHVDAYVKALADLRRLRGEALALRDLRYADLGEAERMEQEVASRTERLARRCTEFLLRDDALAPYEQRLAEQQKQLESLERGSQAEALEQELKKTSDELDMLIEIVSNLPIADSTHRIQIVDAISSFYSRLNQTRAALKNRQRALFEAEGAAEFASQSQLLAQAVTNYLDLCDTPEKCDEYLTRIMVQVEELEGRFADLENYLLQLAEKREEIYAAFESRKLQLVEARNRRAATLMAAAQRLLQGIESRVRGLNSTEEIHSYLAADLMVDKVRDIVEQLGALGDSVKVDDVQGRLKSIREDAVRQLRDRQELFVDGANVIQLGRHRFSVNTQELDLTTVLKDGQMHVHLAGTNFLQPLNDARLEELRDQWDREIVSESPEVYRAEYLAFLCFQEIAAGKNGDSASVLKWNEAELLRHIGAFMAPRYEEGYVKGVHDHDAAKIVRALCELHATLGLVRFASPARALAGLFWMRLGERQRQVLTSRLQQFGLMRRLFPQHPEPARIAGDVQGMIEAFVAEAGIGSTARARQAAEYLCEQLAADRPWCASQQAADLCRALQSVLRNRQYLEQFEAASQLLEDQLPERFRMLQSWLGAVAAERGGSWADYVDEAATLVLDGTLESRQIVAADPARELTGMLGSHPRLKQQTYHLDYHEFLERLERYAAHDVPRFRECHQRKREVLRRLREQMRLDEFKPRVLTSFVRNRLINDVYLPLIGDNLAKQIGSAGQDKRTDLMGLLLLISPPGYGKTTLMEYLANRLGITFVKINGPTIGHQVTSLDPAEAPNASAREEIERLNLALEMGDNVMIYVDDIQHCNAEFLQKFISLCDAQRKIEGVYQGRPRTYDLRGRKVVVVMAGNPYTESGHRFQIPDMLANRADTYNLGDVIGENQQAFELSYLENAITSNATLRRLAGRGPNDVYAIVQMAERDSSEGIDLEGNYSADEIQEMVAVMRKLMRVREVVLKVNQAYIASAAQSDAYRTQPPFKLQGSYRDMNKIAERVVPVMNDQELETLIWTHYENQSQTLTQDAEANLLQLQELLGKLTPEQAARWEEIKRRFQRNQLLAGAGADDPAGRAIAQMNVLAENLSQIDRTLAAGIQMAQLKAASDQSPDELQSAEIREAIGRIAGLQASLAELRDVVASGLSRLVEAAGNGRSAPPAVQEVRVLNRIPSAFLEVIQTQFRLLESCLLAPRSTTGDGVQHLREQLQEVLARYETLARKMESAPRAVRPGPGPSPEPSSSD